MKKLVLVSCFMLFSAFAANAELSPTQKTTVLADINANPDLLALYSVGSLVDVAILYNQPANPEFTVWKTSLPIVDIMTDDNFLWTSVDNLTSGRARIWEELIGLGTINPSKANIRAGLVNAFQSTSIYANIEYLFRRLSTRFEKVLATGTGTFESPGTLTFEGNVTFQDIDSLE